MGVYDSAFKKVFSDKRMFLEFLEAFVPPIKGLGISEDNLFLENTSFTDPALNDRESDLLYRAVYDGNDLFLYVLVEHQSTVDYLMPFRLLVYMTRIWEKCLKEEKTKETNKVKKTNAKKKDFKLPLIIPIVFYDGKRTWKVPLNFKDKILIPDVFYGTDIHNVAGDSIDRFDTNEKLMDKSIFDKYIPKFEYDIVELAKIENEKLLELKNALGLLLTLDSSIKEDLLIVIEKVIGAFKQLPDKEKDLTELYFKALISVFGARNGINAKDIEDIIEKNGGEEMFTIFEWKLKKIEERGIEKGIREGKMEGIREGKMNMAKKLLKMGMNKKDVADISELPLEEIEKIEWE